MIWARKEPNVYVYFVLVASQYNVEQYNYDLIITQSAEFLLTVLNCFLKKTLLQKGISNPMNCIYTETITGRLSVMHSTTSMGFTYIQFV